MTEEPDKTTEPANPLTELVAAAAIAHELYLSFREAGFTEQQALYLVGQVLIGAKPS